MQISESVGDNIGTEARNKSNLTASSVLEFALVEDSNPGCRNTMEDGIINDSHHIVRPFH
jgi:hypothetical protein